MRIYAWGRNAPGIGDLPQHVGKRSIPLSASVYAPFVSLTLFRYSLMQTLSVVTIDSIHPRLNHSRYTR